MGTLGEILSARAAKLEGPVREMLETKKRLETIRKEKERKSLCAKIRRCEELIQSLRDRAQSPEVGSGIRFQKRQLTELKRRLKELEHEHR